MRERRGRWRWFAVLGIVLVVAVWAGTRGRHDPGSAHPPEPSAPSVPSSTTTSQPVPTLTADQNTAHFANQVVTHANKAGINPQLLMAILYNESYKPHDPALQRAWQKIKPDAALGIANMHKAAFDESKQGRDFARRDWQELPDDPDLAIQAAAWYLHDLATQLAAKWSGPYTKDELLALGYDAGASNMKAFARGATPGDVAQSYLDRLRGNWATAGVDIKHVH